MLKEMSNKGRKCNFCSVILSDSYDLEIHLEKDHHVDPVLSDYLARESFRDE